MGDTFKSTWKRPPAHGHGRSQAQVRHRAHYDNEPDKSCLGCLLIAFAILAAALALALGLS